MYRHGRHVEKLHLELTTNCNLACPQCPRTDGDLINPRLIHNELSLDEIMALVPPSDVRTLKHIYACGNFGDPVIAKDFVKIFQYFRKENPDLILGVHTNGSLRNELWWSKLPDILGKHSYVVFPLDGLEDTHHIYRRNSNWGKLMANIKAFISAGGRALCDTLIFKHNVHQIDEIKELAASIGFERQNIRESNRRVPPSVNWLEIMDAGAVETIDSGVIKCMAKLEGGSLFLGADGIFYPCCFIGSANYTRKYPNVSGFTVDDLQYLPHNPTSKTCREVCSVQVDNKTMCEVQIKEEIPL